MASNQPVKTSKTPGGPLAYMQKLSPSVSYFKPPGAPGLQSDRPRDPELILLCSWMGAREEHVAKYVERHRALFPSSRILVAQCPVSHVFLPWLMYFHAKPAAPLLEELVDAGDAQAAHQRGEEDTDVEKAINTKGHPRVLIHAFSNGGVSTAIQIWSQLKARQGGKLVLPRYVFVFDSCPGQFHWRKTALALTQALPGWTSPLIHCALAVVWLFYRLPIVQPAQNRNARAIRNPNHMASELRRTYLYSSGDDVVPSDDIEDQARRAAADGFAVRLERFKGAPHVDVARSDPDRYWSAVRETWDG